METVAPTDPDWHLPFEIVDGPSETGPRLGGRCPAIVLPALRACAHYVLTFPLLRHPPVDASVFVNCDFETLFGAMNDGILDDDRVVIHLHAPAARGVAETFAAEITAHPIVVGEAAWDWMDTDDGEGGQAPMSSHKLGGRPYCIQEPELPGAAELLAEGWRQVLQLDFPARTSVRGSWPFADGLFNIFFRPGHDQRLRWAFQK